MLKKLSLGAAMAAFLATGALAQGAAPTDQPANPPAAAPATPDASTSTTTTTTATKVETVSFKSAMEQSEMLASKLTGMEVRNSAGEDLGDINDIVFDQTGKPTVAIIGVGGFLGLGEKNVGVPFTNLAFADANDGTRVARLDTTKEALKGAPNFVYKDEPTASTTTTTSQQRPVTQ